ncbi:MAG: hypothetical protein Q9O62_00065 [Ardenticatenia bacterium]|nr:hypothetical protein [Ardenticatenia bacterium]
MTGEPVNDRLDVTPAIGKEEAERPVSCPFCGSSETELFGLFGQMHLASQYYCRSCRTVFDYVVWRDV